MKITQMIAAEFRRLFSTKMSILALVALIFVPILYGGLYLWANEDPYGKLSDVPVALIVSDTGAEVNGKPRNIGDEVADELIKSETFDWHEVSSEEADAGLDEGRYDFAVEIPANFTASIASISSDQPRAADLKLRTNDANNYLASTIGKSAVETIQRTVTRKVVAEAGRTMLDGISTIRGKLVTAGDGAGKLTDGIGSARDGVGKLSTGTKSLIDGTGKLSSASSQLAAGTQKIADGSSQMSDGLGTLATKMNDLAAGADRVADGAQQLAGAADKIGDAADSASAALPKLRTKISAELQKQGVPQDRIDQILAELDPVGNDIRAAAGRVSEARGKVDQLSAGATQVANGAAQLRDGAQNAAGKSIELRDGARSAASGAAQLSTGAGALQDGAGKLNEAVGTLGTGLDKLRDGATELRDGLHSGAQSLPDSTVETRAAQAKVMGAPVDIKKTTRTAAENYGAGLAPFFAALAAWIGIYALFLIVKPISRRAVTALHSPIRVTLAGWATPAILGAVQMLGLFGVLAIALGFNFANPVGAIALLILASATYTSVILALTVWLGSVGKFMGLVLMVLQLVTAGGTFPWQTLPEPLAALHHVLPMSYVVDAMRQIMYGSVGFDRIGNDLLVLLIWLVGGLLVSALGVARMTRKRTLRDLEPSIIG